VVNASPVYDDFAHHPTAIDTTVAGLRRKGREVTHPRGTGTALQHHEARRDERCPAGQFEGCRSGVLLRRQPWLGCARCAGPLGSKAVVEDDLAVLTERIAAASRPVIIFW